MAQQKKPSFLNPLHVLRGTKEENNSGGKIYPKGRPQEEKVIPPVKRYIFTEDQPTEELVDEKSNESQIYEESSSNQSLESLQENKKGLNQSIAEETQSDISVNHATNKNTAMPAEKKSEKKRFIDLPRPKVKVIEHDIEDDEVTKTVHFASETNGSKKTLKEKTAVPEDNAQQNQKYNFTTEIHLPDNAASYTSAGTKVSDGKKEKDDKTFEEAKGKESENKNIEEKLSGYTEEEIIQIAKDLETLKEIGKSNVVVKTEYSSTPLITLGIVIVIIGLIASFMGYGPKPLKIVEQIEENFNSVEVKPW